MAASVNSFDVFDTLIARRSGAPHAVLQRLERASGVAGVAAARVAADQVLWHRGQPYTLADLWQEAGRALGLAAPDIRRLYADNPDARSKTIPRLENLGSNPTLYANPDLSLAP